MIIGVPKETKNNEYRVGLLPVGVEMLTAAGHRVLMEEGAAKGSGIRDEEYEHSGAIMVKSPAEVFGQAQMIVKIKEPLPTEYHLLREGQIIFTYFHFSPNP